MINVVWFTLLSIGAFGLVVQLLLGGHFGHHFGHSHHITHISTGSRHSDPGPQHADTRHLTSARNTPEGKGDVSSTRMGLLLTVLSPMTIFSVCLGAGATGLLLKHVHVGLVLIVTLAIIGGLVFYVLVSRPLMTVLLKFASQPSKALDGVVSEPAEVISHFDSSGRGLVNLTVDGQIVRVLATLEDSDKPNASEIVPGDRLLVTYVDGHSNACRVARI